MQRKVKHHFNSPLAKFMSLFGFGGITLSNHVFYKWSREEISIRKIAHELVHVDQIREVGAFRFYVSYLCEFVANFIMVGDFMQAYYSLSYELEAYKKELNFEYLQRAQEVLDEN